MLAIYIWKYENTLTNSFLFIFSGIMTDCVLQHWGALEPAIRQWGWLWEFYIPPHIRWVIPSPDFAILKDLGSSRYDLIIDVSADRWRLLQNWNLQINSIIRFSLSAAMVILSHGLLLSNTALSPCNGTSEISVFSLLQEIRSFLGFKSHCLKC